MNKRIRIVNRAYLSHAVQLDFWGSPVLYSVSSAYIHGLISAFFPMGRLFGTSRTNTLAWGHACVGSGRVVPNMESLPCYTETSLSWTRLGQLSRALGNLQGLSLESRRHATYVGVCRIISLSAYREWLWTLNVTCTSSTV